MSDLTKWYELSHEDRKKILEDFRKTSDFEICAKIVDDLKDYSWEFKHVHAQSALSKAAEMIRAHVYFEAMRRHIERPN